MTSYIFADEYDATVQAVTEAINRSVNHNEIVRITSMHHRDELRTALFDACDGTVDTGNEAEYWGTDDNGDSWRVHLVRDRQGD